MLLDFYPKTGTMRLMVKMLTFQKNIYNSDVYSWKCIFFTNNKCHFCSERTDNDA